MQNSWAVKDTIWKLLVSYDNYKPGGKSNENCKIIKKMF